jgi:hypothetical protein
MGGFHVQFDLALRVSLYALGGTLAGGLVVLSGPAASQTPPTFAVTVSGTCLYSTSGFRSNFEPKAGGMAWAESYNSVLSGNVQMVSPSLIYTPVIEIGSSVLSAAFGAGGDRAHPLQ